VNLEPGAGHQMPGSASSRAKPKARSAGWSRKVIHIMPEIVVLIIWQFLGSLIVGQAGPMTACGVCVFRCVTVPMKRVERRKRLGRCEE